MICPECKTNVNDNLQYCPVCGAPLPTHTHQQTADDGELKLSRSMKIFIIVGTILLLVMTGLSYTNFAGGNNPDIAVDPDTTLLGKERPVYEEYDVDSVKTDSIKKAEDAEAKKVYESIRKEETTEESAEDANSSPAADNPSAGEAPSEQKHSEQIVVEPVTKPKVEKIEN